MISVTNCSKPVLKGQTNVGRVTDGSTQKIRGIKQIIALRGGRVPEPLSLQPTESRCRFGSACSADREEKPSDYDAASKYRGASSKSTPEGKSVLALAAVRHQKSPQVISFQEKTRSDVQGQENPGQESGDRLHFQGVQAPGDGSHEVPEWLQFFKAGFSGENPDSHHVVVEQPVVEPKEKTPDGESQLRRRVNRSSIFRRTVQETKHKQANWQALFLNTFSQISKI